MSPLLITFISLSSFVGNSLSLNPNINHSRNILRPYNRKVDATDCIILTVETVSTVYKSNCEDDCYLSDNISHFVAYWFCMWPSELLKREHLFYDDFKPCYKSTCRFFIYLTTSRDERRKLYSFLVNDRNVEKEIREAYGVPEDLPDTPEHDTIENTSRTYYLPHKVCSRVASRFSHRVACLACIPLGQLTNYCMTGLSSSKKLKDFIYGLEEYILGEKASTTNNNTQKVPNIFLPENLKKLEAAKNEIDKYSVVLGNLVYGNQESTNPNCTNSTQGESENVITNRKEVETMLEFANQVRCDLQLVIDDTRKLTLRASKKDVPDLSNNIKDLKRRIELDKKTSESAKLKLENLEKANKGQSTSGESDSKFRPDTLEQTRSEIANNKRRFEIATKLLKVINNLLDNLLVLEKISIPGHKMSDSVRKLIETFYKEPVIQICEYHEEHASHLDDIENYLISYYSKLNDDTPPVEKTRKT